MFLEKKRKYQEFLTMGDIINLIRSAGAGAFVVLSEDEFGNQEGILAKDAIKLILDYLDIHIENKDGKNIIVSNRSDP